MRLRPALVTALAGVLAYSPPTVAQQSNGSAASHAAPSPSSPTLTLHGRVISLEGEPLPGATVWVEQLSSASSRLAESRVSQTGEFTLVFSLPAQAPYRTVQGQAGLFERPSLTRMAVRASQPGYNDAVDFFTLDGRASLPAQAPYRTVQGQAGLPAFTLRLMSSEETFEDPDFGQVDTWLLPRLARLHSCGRENASECGVLKAAMARYRKRSENQEALEAVVERTVSAPLPYGTGPAQAGSSLPGVRLLEALAFMRLGAWTAAETTLAPLVRESPNLPEAWFEEGVLFNFLHRPGEAMQALARARQDLPRAPLVNLELGRAALRAEKWETAEENLSAAMVDRSLRQSARYLRARTLMDQGLVEAASREASELMRETRHKPLPVTAQAFVVDLGRRLEEESIQPITSVMQQPVPELVKLVLPLRGVDPSAPPPPGGLDVLLKHVGLVVDKFFRDFTNTSATEILWQTRLDKNGKPVESRNEQFYYVFLTRSEQGRWWVEEYRGDRKGLPSSPGGLEAGYMTTSGFASSLVVFHPRFQPGMFYRYLGRQKVGDQWSYVVGFAQSPGVSAPLGFFNISQSKTAQLYLQGIAWISEDQHEVIRMRTDLLGPVPEVQLKRETAEVDYRPYRFTSSPRAFWLPNRVSVSVEWSGKRLRNEHLFSQYRLFKVDTEETRARGGNPVQKSAVQPE